jgi:hypothetical protein
MMETWQLEMQSGVGTISPTELKKLGRCGSFDLSGPFIYQRL